MTTTVYADTILCSPNNDTVTIPHNVEVDGNVNIDGTLTTTGPIAFTGPVDLPSYVKASLPSASSASQLIYVSDATGLYHTGSLAFSIATGTGSWVDVTTGNFVV